MTSTLLLLLPQSLLEPFSKLVSFVIQYGVFSLSYLVELCGLCYRTFNKVPLSDVCGSSSHMRHTCVSLAS